MKNRNIFKLSITGKVLKVFCLMTLLPLMNSCSDILDVETPSKFDVNEVFSSVEYSQQALMGIYNLFGQDSYTSRMSNVWMQNTDVEASAPQAGVPANDRRAVWSLQATAITGFSDVATAWNHNLQAIDRANQFIAGVENSPVGSESEMQQMKGEAIMLKAYRYLLMCNFWGDVPYYTVASAWGGDLDKPRTDKFVIYSRMLQQMVDIEPSMKFSDVNTGGIERITRDYAIGLIAKMALFRAGYGKTIDNQMKRAEDYLDVSADSLSVTYKDLNGGEVTAHSSADYYQMAKTYAQKLISLKPRPLYSDFSTAFMNENTYTVENNKEILYEVAFVEGFGGDVGWCFGVTNTGSCFRGTTTNQVGLTPTYYMSFADNDQRRDVTCGWWKHDNDTVGVNGVTGLTVGKWDRSLATHDLGGSSSKGTGINFPLMRYSEVLLMLAEAENELNGPTALAKEALRTVRARAFSQSPDYDHDVRAYVDSVAGSKASFFNAIVDERAWEFGGEGLRRFDLIRWNLYAQKIEQTMETMLYWGMAQTPDLMKQEAVANNEQVQRYGRWARYLYYQLGSTGDNTKQRVRWLNTKYNVEEGTDVAGWYRLNWGASMLKRVRTFIYNNTSYDACTKVTNADTGAVEYTLGTGGGALKITVAAGEPSGVTQHDEYQLCDYATRLYRGYANGELRGSGIVPFLLPICTTTLNASSVLSNEGYGILANDPGEGVNVKVAYADKENY